MIKTKINTKIIFIFLWFIRVVSKINPKAGRYFWRYFIKMWYQHISELDINAQITFMNYGYVDLDSNTNEIELKGIDESNRYSIQLYHKVAGFIDLKGLDVLEIGSGRGGGAAYVMQYLSPKSMTGVDLSEKAIEFCNAHYNIRNLSFARSNAESLFFDNSSMDVIINIESSHCYKNMSGFLSEVYRILHDNGYFLFADYRSENNIDSLRKLFKLHGFNVLHEEVITPNIVKALELDNKRKLDLITQIVPKELYKFFLPFAGITGSWQYESFKTGDRKYMFLACDKINN